MHPLDNLTKEQARNISFILTDIDDTLTLNGKLLPEAYNALWKLAGMNIRIIPVTGRPAGWCDMIARFWPVDAVIGENGAFVFYLENERMKRIYHPEADRENSEKRLSALGQKILEQVPGSRIAEDQFSRLFDLAVDYREQPPFLSLEDAEKIRQICIDEDASAKVSSIHVNTWFGNYDKLTMTRLFFKDRYPQTDLFEEVLFVGDSPNDEPMFAFFPLSCGVGNIRSFLTRITSKPVFITDGEGSYGFAELVERIELLRE